MGPADRAPQCGAAVSAVVWLLVAAAVVMWPWPDRRLNGVFPAGRPACRGRGRRRMRRRAWLAAAAQGELGDAMALMAAPVRVGVAPVSALGSAVRAMPSGGPLQPLFEDLVGAAAHGESVAAVWLSHADETADADLRFIGQAWWLSEVTGAPLAGALHTAEHVLRSRERSRQRLASAVAGPRASMAVLALLPLCGPLVGLAFGVTPRALYLSSPAARASPGVGVFIGLLAWWWSRRIITGATGTTRATGATGATRATGATGASEATGLSALSGLRER